MRNLKKILALVLALVMSLSLMATAGAAETTAADSNPYATAQKVLEGLNVFQGNPDGSMNYDQSITRVQAAALVYRVATSDVTDAQKDMYTNHPFKDVPAGYWGNGYISYGYNAEILKGYNATTFGYDDQVTGHQVLAMVLRTLGYGKNHEFEGANWEIQTAATAKQEGLLSGVTAADETRLGQPASRGLVAQILFNALLQKTVKYSALNPYNYEPTTGETLGYQKFGLEKITGVVMANQWADLENTKVLADGKTRMIADGKNYNLDYATERDDIGESRLTYVQNGTKVLHMEDSKLNNVKFNEGKKDTVADLRGDLDVTDAEHFINFSDVEANSSEWLIRYSATVGTVDAAGKFLTYERWYAAPDGTYTTYGEYLNKLKSGDYALYAPNATKKDRNATVTSRTVKDNNGNIQYVMTVSLEPGTVINDYDRGIMQQIFYTADRWAENPGVPVTGVDYYINGEVYAGTTSLTDKSDVMSWNQFVKEYLTTDEVKVVKVENGNELKIIDNNNDGKAEYVLKTVYTLDKIVRSVEKDSATTYYYQGLDIDTYKPVYLDGYTPALEDVVLYALIDGTAQMQKAESAAASFKSVNYKDETATDTDGKTWEQSGINNATVMKDILTGVDEYAPYTLYLDKYGFVRAYDTKTTYALVTEIYPTTTQNQAWVTSKDLTAEIKLGDAAPAEYPLANNYASGSFNPFYITNPAAPTTPWTAPYINPIYNDVNLGVDHGAGITGTRRNYLQPATHGLGTVGQAASAFAFGAPAGEEHQYSWTNVAKCNMDGTSVNLTTAANYEYDKQNTPRANEDYIQLKVAATDAKNPLYKTNDSFYTGTTNEYVRAVDDTEFYVVARQDGRIEHYVGYSKVPALKVADNGIHAMYAVAERVNRDVETNAYWVANVIVIEIETFGKKVDSVSLIYSNDYKVSGDIKYLQAIDSEKGQIGIIPTNSDWQYWQGQFSNRGFFTLSNTRAVEGQENIYYAELNKITDKSSRAVTASDGYNANGIYYGVVRSLNGELSRSSYITVDKPVYDENGNVKWETTYVTPKGGAYGIDGDKYDRVDDAVDLINDYHASKQVQVGDEIVWVEGGKAFLVDLTDFDLDAFGREVERDWYPTPTWLYDQSWIDGELPTRTAGRGEVGKVILDQITDTSDAAQAGTFYGVKFYVDGTVEKTVDYTTAAEYWATNKDAIVTVDDYKATSCVVTGTTGPQSWPTSPNPDADMKYTLTVTKDGKSYTINLVQKAAASNQLSVGGIITGVDYTTDPAVVSTVAYAQDLHIDEFQAEIQKQTKLKISDGWWNFYYKDGTKIDPVHYGSIEMDKVGTWSLALANEAGQWQLYSNSAAAVTPGEQILVVTVVTEDGLKQENATLTKNTTTGDWTLTVTTDTKEPPVIVINDVPYVMTGSSMTLSTTYTWTLKLTAAWIKANLPAEPVILIVVRAKTADDKEPEKSSDATLKVTTDGTGKVSVDDTANTITIATTVAEKDRTVENLLKWVDNVKATSIVVKDDKGTVVTTGAVAKGYTVTVTAEDGKATKTYTIDVNEITVKYNVTIDSKITNGTVTTDKASAAAKETVTLTVKPATTGKGYQLDKLTVTDADKGTVVTKKVDDSTYTFVMPAKNVTVTATFVEKSEAGAAEGIKATVTYDTTNNKLVAAFKAYLGSTHATKTLTAAEIAAALSQENDLLHASDGKYVVSPDDVDLTAKTATTSKGEVIYFTTNEVTPGANELFKVTYPSNQVVYWNGSNCVLENIPADVLALLPKDTIASSTGVTVNAATHKSAAITVGGDIEYVAALPIANATTDGDGNIETGSSNDTILVGTGMGDAFQALNLSSGGYIQPGKSLTFKNPAAGTATYGEQVVLTIGSTEYTFVVDKEGKLSERAITINSNDVDSTTKTVVMTAAIENAEFPVYLGADKTKPLSAYDDSGTTKAIVNKSDLPEGVTTLVYQDAEGALTAVTTSPYGSDYEATIDTNKAINGEIHLLPAYTITGRTHNSDTWGLYATYTSNTGAVSDEVTTDDGSTYVLADGTGKVYLKADNAEVDLKISSSKKSTMTAVKGHEATTGDSAVPAIWEIAVREDLNVTDFSFIADLHTDPVKVEFQGSIPNNAASSAITLTNIIAGNTSDITSINIIPDASLSGRSFTVSDITAGGAITIKLQIDNKGAALSQPGDSTNTEVGVAVVAFANGWTASVEIELKK